MIETWKFIAEILGIMPEYNILLDNYTEITNEYFSFMNCRFKHVRHSSHYLIAKYIESYEYLGITKNE